MIDGASYTAPPSTPNRYSQCFIDVSAKIGQGSAIWHFAVILAGVIIGENCSIGGSAEIGKNSIIGDYTRISHGVFLPAGSIVGNHVFIGPSVTCTDDKYPRAGAKYVAQPPIIEDFASIGAGAVLLPGVRIGSGALVGAGAVVTHDVEDGTTVYGNPAR